MAYVSDATQVVYDYIVSKIQLGQWTPGMKISTETQLCNELNVSRMAVRQAIEKLSALSVLRKEQGSGTYVEHFKDASLPSLPLYPSDKATTLMVLEFRKMFDSYNAELFISKCSGEEVALLQKNYEQMKNSAGDREAFRYYDNQFHDIISRGTQNAIISHISDIFMDAMTSNQTVIFQSIGPENAIKYHGMILEAIMEGNSELASIYSRMHIETSIERIRSMSEASFRSTLGH